MDKKFLIGVDAGGTKTHALITTENGDTVAEWVSGPGNYITVGLKKAIENIFDSISTAILKAKTKHKDLQIAGLCIGIASLDTKHDFTLLHNALHTELQKHKLPQPLLVNDTLIALRAASDSKNAVVLICGTGSHAYGVNENGHDAHVGGLDYILSDEGSGYMIGALALRAAIKSMDGRGEQTILEKLLCEQLKIQSIKEAKNIVYNPHFTKKDFAAFVDLVFRAVDEKDDAAIQIVESQAKEAYSLFAAATEKLNMIKPFDVVLSGGLFTRQIFKETIVQRIIHAFPDAKIIVPEKPPAFGAIQLILTTLIFEKHLASSEKSLYSKS